MPFKIADSRAQDAPGRPIKHVPMELTCMINNLKTIDTEARNVCNRGDELRRDYILHRETFEALVKICDKCNQISFIAMRAQELLEELRRN